ncbi:hypothetical protein ACIQPR_18285 [Streptomyces sp. NPDC091280]|uniref:hypothetical protein n=1 Tax=Streptomyces sp. NPDC091280 TaxID=3365984 RepID=UPI0037FDD56B
MIKVRVRDRAGDPLVLLGLTRENTTRLLADEPILVDLAELGLPPLRIALVGGHDEQHVAQQLERYCGPLPFICPRCTRTSHHPDDKRYGYCGACHAYTGAPTL